MIGRLRFPLAADLIVGICPAEDGSSASVVWAERDATHAVDFIIVGKDAAYNARRLAQLLLLAAEAIDPLAEHEGVDDETVWLESKLRGPVGRSPLTTRSDRTEGTERDVIRGDTADPEPSRLTGP